jgi:hypothetical protein
MGSRLIESAAYCNQIWLTQLYINRAQNTSVIVIAYVSAQSDPIKRRTLYSQTSVQQDTKFVAVVDWWSVVVQR